MQAELERMLQNCIFIVITGPIISLFPFVIWNLSSFVGIITLSFVQSKITFIGKIVEQSCQDFFFF